jgi:hypothetical protein
MRLMTAACQAPRSRLPDASRRGTVKPVPEQTALILKASFCHWLMSGTSSMRCTSGGDIYAYVYTTQAYHESLRVLPTCWLFPKSPGVRGWCQKMGGSGALRAAHQAPARRRAAARCRAAALGRWPPAPGRARRTAAVHGSIGSVFGKFAVKCTSRSLQTAPSAPGLPAAVYRSVTSPYPALPLRQGSPSRARPHCPLRRAWTLRRWTLSSCGRSARAAGALFGACGLRLQRAACLRAHPYPSAKLPRGHSFASAGKASL